MMCKNLWVLFLLLFACCKNIVKDIDGNIYTYVLIGDTYWLQQNLKTEHYQNGDPITIVTENEKWFQSRTEMMCYYNNDIGNKNIYGALYNWHVAKDERNVCPVGWQVASKEDYRKLSDLFGGDVVSGQHLKSNEQNLWIDTTSPITNKSRFNGIPSGNRDDFGGLSFNTFKRKGYYAFYWTRNDDIFPNCLPDSLACAYECSLNAELTFFNRDEGQKKRGMSIRCVKNKEY